MSVDAAGTKSKAEKGAGDDFERPLVLKAKRDGFALSLLSVPARGRTNAGGTTASRSYCKGAAYHGTTDGSREDDDVAGDVDPAAAREAVSEEAIASPRFPSNNFRARLLWVVVEGPSLTLILDIVRDARDGVDRTDRFERD